MKRILTLLILVTNVAFAQVKVSFVITGWPAKTPGMQKVYLAGNFNGWQPANEKWLFEVNSAGSYQLVQTLAPGNYEYKVTRGTWDKAECSATGTSIANRVLHLVHDTTVNLQVADWQDLHPIEKKHTVSANVHIISEKFDMPQLGRQRRVWIYLPAGYATSKKKYPVIYMHDGQNLFDEYTAGYGQEWGVDEFMDKLPQQQQAIIVGIDHGGDNRITEYDPYDSKYGNGRGDDYAKFMVETLKPYIDSHYQTLTDAKHTTVAGSSMGGIISMYIAVKYPKVFGRAGIFSPAFWIGPQIYDYAKANALKTSRFYFVCGDLEGDTEVAETQKMADILKAKDLPEKNIPVTVIKGAKHNEQQWRSAFPAFYAWLTTNK